MPCPLFFQNSPVDNLFRSDTLCITLSGESMAAVEDVLRLASVMGLGPRTYRVLLEHFGSVDRILCASFSELSAVEGLRAAVRDGIISSFSYDPRPELESASRAGVRILTQANPEYPKALLTIYDPPILLWIRGSLLDSDSISIGMVGTRQPSHYGRSQAERFTSQLSRLGFTVVSGLARGIDSVCHRSALKAGGRTLAVLGSGLDHIYPEENRDLVVEIAENGAVISEFPMDTGPSRENFPRRNRIIAGISLGVLVVEAPHRSGSLITARIANELGREVFAIPGRIDQRNAEGGNHLIQRGEAKLVSSVEEVIEEFGPVADGLIPCNREMEQVRLDLDEVPVPVIPSGRMPAPEDEKESRILQALEANNLHIDEICAATGLAVPHVSATLMMLELKRKVKRFPGRIYACL